MIINKLAIGTAQFGSDYGVANVSGRVSQDDVGYILDHAIENKITMLDTAIAYGESERALGEVGVNGFSVVTKLPSTEGIQPSEVDSWVSEQVNKSLKLLGVQKVYGLLLHRPLELLDKQGRALYQSLQRIRNSGLAEKVGISIYEPSDLDQLCGEFKVDLVQLPFNILDNRWDFWLQKLHQEGVEIHVRSIFLQGLLLMSVNNRPSKFNRWDVLWQELEEWLGLNKITAVQACLMHALSKSEISKVIVGIDSKKQLEQLITTIVDKNPVINSKLQTDDVMLLNPSNWNDL